MAAAPPEAAPAAAPVWLRPLLEAQASLQKAQEEQAKALAALSKETSGVKDLIAQLRTDLGRGRLGPAQELPDKSPPSCRPGGKAVFLSDIQPERRAAHHMGTAMMYTQEHHDRRSGLEEKLAERRSGRDPDGDGVLSAAVSKSFSYHLISPYACVPKRAAHSRPPTHDEHPPARSCSRRRPLPTYQLRA